MEKDSIPESWIKYYIDQLLEGASKLEPGPMQDTLLLRADNIMDLVKSWRDAVNGTISSIG